MKRLVAFAGITVVAAAATAAMLANGSNGVDNAKPGAHIVLPASQGQVLKISGKSFEPAITIDASKAVLSGIVISDSQGVHIKGGTVIGPGGRSYGVRIDRSRDVRIEGMTITGAHRGIVAGASEDLVIADNQLTGLQSDGINLPQSRRVLVSGNSCSKFTPRPATYDESGKKLTDGDHPDCIQSWSRPTLPPVADIKIVNNRIEGRMQGIFFGNHVRDGVDDGGFDRITIEGNLIRVSSWNGIALGTARDSVIRGNRVSSIPGVFAPKGQPIVARIIVNRPTNVLACGNVVDNPKVRTGTEPCPR